MTHGSIFPKVNGKQPLLGGERRPALRFPAIRGHRQDLPKAATGRIGGFRCKFGTLGEPTARRDTAPCMSRSNIRLSTRGAF